MGKTGTLLGHLPLGSSGPGLGGQTRGIPRTNIQPASHIPFPSPKPEEFGWRRSWDWVWRERFFEERERNKRSWSMAETQLRIRVCGWIGLKGRGTLGLPVKQGKEKINQWWWEWVITYKCCLAINQMFMFQSLYSSLDSLQLTLQAWGKYYLNKLELSSHLKMNRKDLFHLHMSSRKDWLKVHEAANTLLRTSQVSVMNGVVECGEGRDLEREGTKEEGK